MFLGHPVISLFYIENHFCRETTRENKQFSSALLNISELWIVSKDGLFPNSVQDSISSDLCENGKP